LADGYSRRQERDSHAHELLLAGVTVGEVRTFSHDQNNDVGDRDEASERMFIENEMTLDSLDCQLSALMRDRSEVRVVVDADVGEHAKLS
jgi:predicted transcriptional regulator